VEAQRGRFGGLGGFGDTVDFPVGSRYRDTRLNRLHGGTNGVQGLDLLGRKVLGRGRGNLDILFAEVDRTLGDLAQDSALSPLCDRLCDVQRQIQESADTVEANVTTAGKVRALGNATPFLNAFGHYVVAWLWLRAAGQTQLANLDPAFADGKRAACQYFFEYELPQAEVWLRTACTDAAFLDAVTPVSL